MGLLVGSKQVWQFVMLFKMSKSQRTYVFVYGTCIQRSFSLRYTSFLFMPIYVLQLCSCQLLFTARVQRINSKDRVCAADTRQSIPIPGRW